MLSYRFFFSGIDKPKGFRLNVPYSGSEYADIHIGIQMGDTQGKSKSLNFTVTQEQLEIYNAGIQIVIDAFKQIIKEDLEDEEEIKIAKQFVEEIQKQPGIYYAYSTS